MYVFLVSLVMALVGVMLVMLAMLVMLVMLVIPSSRMCFFSTVAFFYNSAMRNFSSWPVIIGTTFTFILCLHVTKINRYLFFRLFSDFSALLCYSMVWKHENKQVPLLKY